MEDYGFEVGDFVVRTYTGGYEDWTKKTMSKPRRILAISVTKCISIKGMPYCRGDTNYPDTHPGWWGKYFRHATKEEIADTPFEDGDIVKLSPGGVVLMLVSSYKVRPWAHATPEEYRKFMYKAMMWDDVLTDGKVVTDTTIKTSIDELIEDLVDAPLEDSRDEMSQEIDAAKLEATLGDHENRLSNLLQRCTHQARRLDDTIADLENKPKSHSSELLQDRITGDGPFILVTIAAKDNHGRSPYYSGQNSEGSNDQLYRFLWPETLEPVPVPEKGVKITAPVKAEDWWKSKQSNKYYHLGRSDEKEYNKGPDAATAIFTILITSIIWCVCLFILQ